MTEMQTQFRTALLDANQPVPDGLCDGNAAPAGRRFSVYRNNVILSLTDALAASFPLVCKLLGAESFDRLANIYVRANPPSSPVMMHFGSHFPNYLTSFEPLQNIGYLPDCARLDLALRQSYHARDADPLNSDAFDAPPDQLMQLTLKPAPATQVLRSAWPLFDIWRFNMEPGAPKPRAQAQDVLISRPEFDPEPHLLPRGGAVLLQRMLACQTLGEAFDKALKDTPTFDLAKTLEIVLRTNALTGTKTKD